MSERDTIRPKLDRKLVTDARDKKRAETGALTLSSTMAIQMVLQEYLTEREGTE